MFVFSPLAQPTSKPRVPFSMCEPNHRRYASRREIFRSGPQFELLFLVLLLDLQRRLPP